MANDVYQVHGAIRSSAAWRVRIALKLKHLPYREIYLDLHAGQHTTSDYRGVNPQGLVPALVCPDGLVVTQSMAIIEYLDETHPVFPLLPADPAGRARVRALAQIVACDMHPVNNLRIRNHVRDLLPADPDAVSKWMEKWSAAGFDALEALLDDARTGRFCQGDAPSLADACLAPQIGNARLMGLSIARWPIVSRLAAVYDAHPDFDAARPERQTA